MRKIVAMMSVSLDGYFEGPNRELDWGLVDEELHSHFNAWLREADAFLDGRVTYELMADFWPTADEDPAASPTVAEFAGIWREMPKIVYSRTLEHAAAGTTVVHEVVADEVLALKEAPGDGFLVLGGAELGAAFRRLDLIDEYRIYVHPVVLGNGKPLFGPGEQRAALDLLETRTFGNGVVLLHYAVSRP